MNPIEEDPVGFFHHKKDGWKQKHNQYWNENNWRRMPHEWLETNDINISKITQHIYSTSTNNYNNVPTFFFLFFFFFIFLIHSIRPRLEHIPSNTIIWNTCFIPVFNDLSIFLFRYFLNEWMNEQQERRLEREYKSSKAS